MARLPRARAACPPCPALGQPAANPPACTPEAGRGGTRSFEPLGIPSGEPQPVFRAQGGALGTRLLPSVPGRETGRRLALAPQDPPGLALRSPPLGLPSPPSPRSASREPRVL